MDINKINQLAYDNMKERKSPWFKEKGSIYFHGRRTGKLTIKLREKIFPKDDSKDNILLVAGLFHDIGKDIKPHNENGALIASKLLKRYCSQEELKDIGNYISLHNQRGKSDNKFIQILQDADILDHQGSIHVWVHFITNINFGLNMDDSIEYWEKNIKNDNDVPDYLNHDVAKEIYVERRKYFNSFMERLIKENNGDII